MKVFCFRWKPVIVALFILQGQIAMAQTVFFENEKNWDWGILLASAKNPETVERIQELRSLLSLQEVQFLIFQLQRLNAPEDLKKLASLEREQKQRGGGFYGIIPDYFTEPDNLPLPDSFDNLISTALHLAKIRNKNEQIIANPAFQFPLTFQNKPLPVPAMNSVNKNIQLYFDFSAIESLLKLFAKENATFTQAQKATNNIAFKEMIAHRKSLGYLPEPLPDEEDLAQFAFWTASRDPVLEIWKWLNPWNDFGLADLYQNRETYNQLLVYWKQNSRRLERLVSERLSLCVPPEIQFKDTIRFAVNFGIRSWATSHGLGTNLIQFKDHYSLMLQTITHETFHRLQLKICPVYQGSKPEFEDLVKAPFAEVSDQKFYEALSYIMLEGTATYVGGADSIVQTNERIVQGKQLLENIFVALYQEKDFKKYQQLLNQGLRSNGSFYSLGYYMSKAIARTYGPEEIGMLLQKGSPAFFLKFNSINRSNDFPLNQKILDKINFLKFKEQS